MLWIALITTAVGQPVDTANHDGASGCSCVARQYCRGTWVVQETTNFRIWSRLPVEQGTALAEDCEAARAELRKKWFSEESTGIWVPKCEIVVHSTIGEYNQALGCVNDSSVGCTTLKVDGERVVYRRIDLRVDAPDWKTSALPHELTHAVVADCLDRRTLPPWADEGMAALAEPQVKKARRLDRLDLAVRRGNVYRLRDLLKLRQAPSVEYRDAFYGQSVSLVSFLVERETPEAFVRFLQLAGERGHQAALQEVYDFASDDQLEQHWRSWSRNDLQVDSLTATTAKNAR